MFGPSRKGVDRQIGVEDVERGDVVDVTGRTSRTETK